MSSEVLSCPEYLQVQGTDSFNIERIKKGFYEQLKTCWVTSTEDRPGSKRLLKSFHTCIQTNSMYNQRGCFIAYLIHINSPYFGGSLSIRTSTPAYPGRFWEYSEYDATT